MLTTKAGNDEATIAAVPRTPATTAELPGMATQGDMLRRVLGIGLTGLGAGMGVRGLLGLRDVLAQPFSHPPKQKHPAVVEVNVPEAEKEDEPEPPVRRRSLKLAEDTTLGDVGMNAVKKIGGGALDLGGNAVKAVGEDIFGMPKQHFDMVDYLLGRAHKDVTSKPPFYPLAAAATGAGLLGGYYGLDKAFKGMQKRDKDKELEQAKEDYRRALIEQYAPENVKYGSEQSELHKNLDQLWQLQKQADLSDTVWNLGGKGTGLYLALAGALAGGSGLAAYNFTKDRGQHEALANAIKQRAQLRALTRPPEIYAVAKPSRVSVADEDEEEKRHPDSGLDLARKVAELYKS